MKRVLVILLVVSAAVAFVLTQGGASDEERGNRWVAEFDNAFGLVVGGDLKIGGVRAGRITGMDVDRRTKRALVEFEVSKEGFGSLRADVTCESRPQSLIGEYFIDCDPGTDREKLEPGSKIPVERTASTIPPDLVNNILREPYRDRLRIILAELGYAADEIAALRAAGAALRAAIAGLRALLIARADVKREFRIEQTMLRAAGNNPVKFAATEEAAIAALLAGAGGAGPRSVEETVADLTAHQVATLAATQAAARALLDRLAPAALEAQEQGGGGLFGAGREKRLWEAYKRLHQQVTEQFDDDFDSAFGKSFARAYEQASRRGDGAG